MMQTSTQLRRSSPAAEGAQGPGWRDVVLVAVLLVATVLEVLLRSDLVWPATTVVVMLALLAPLPWRRSRPLLVVVATTAVTAVFSIAQAIGGVPQSGLLTMFGVLTVPYALFRWGSGRARYIGGAILAAGVILAIVQGGEGISGAIAGVAFVGGACLIGALRRERVTARARELDAVRAREREALARDLHDTVAHHVSAIAIRAQAAATVAHDADRVSHSLHVIEREAQTTLTEMRALVRTLRAPTDYMPPGDLSGLVALATPGPPRVSVRVDAPSALPEILASTLFRVAQEGITNARRHAAAVTEIDVVVVADEETVTIVVRDDGVATDGEYQGQGQGQGQGLLGMRERAALLQGTFAAGADPAGGWTLRVALPTRDPG